MTRFVGGFNPMGSSAYAPARAFLSGAARAVCDRAAHHEAHYGYARYASNGPMRYCRAYERAAMRFMPRWAPEPKAESSSGPKSKRDQQPQKTNNANQTNASSKTDPEEAKAKQEAEQKKKRHDAAVESLKKLRGDPDGKTEAERDGTAVTALVSSKGYSKPEARKIVALINKMVPMDFGGDPVKAEAALKKYQDYLNGVPPRKNGKGKKRPHADWAADYATWVGDMKGVKPSEAAQVPISDVMGVTGKGKRQKVSKKKAKHAVLVPIGLKTVKGGKVYDAFRVSKSSDVDIIPRNATVVRDADKKWYILKGDGSLDRIKRGRRKDPVFDKKGILIIDPRYSKIALVPIETYDAGDINKKIEDWIEANPEVKTKQDFSSKRSEDVKKALEKSLHSRFGSDAYTVSTVGKNVMIRVDGDDKVRSARAKRLAAYMRDNEGHFASIFGDLPGDAYVMVQDKANRVSAGQKGTFRGVVKEVEKLQTYVSLPVLDIRMYRGRGDAVPSVKYVERRLKLLKPDSVRGKKVFLVLRYANKYKPDEKAIKALVKKTFKKDGREVKVVLKGVDVAEPSGYDAKLKERIEASLWDGSKRSKSRVKAQAARIFKNARTGGGRSRVYRNSKLLLPIEVDIFERKVNADLRKHADIMRRNLIASKGSKKRDRMEKQYRAWWAVAKKFLAKHGDYYRPETVEKLHPRAPAVYRKRRGNHRPNSGGNNRKDDDLNSQPVSDNSSNDKDTTVAAMPGTGMRHPAFRRPGGMELKY